MWTWLCVPMVLAGCGRIGFADRTADAAVDAAPLQLACNTPVQIGAAAATMAELSATATESYVVVMWVEDSGALGVGGARLNSALEVALPVPVHDLAISGRSDRVGLASDGSRLLAAFGDSTGTGSFATFDAFGRQLDAPTQTTVHVSVGRAVAAAAGALGPAFAVSGFDGTRTAIVGADASNQLVGTELLLGMSDLRIVLVSYTARIAVVVGGSTMVCELSSVDLGLTATTTPVQWGVSGSCSDPVAAYSPGRSDLLVVRKDLADGDVADAIATINGTTFAIGSEQMVAAAANQPRAVGIADGYWVTYERLGALEATHVDFAGVATAAAVVLGPMADATAHDLVSFSGEAYAVWLDNGLQLARLCE